MLVSDVSGFQATGRLSCALKHCVIKRANKEVRDLVWAKAQKEKV